MMHINCELINEHAKDLTWEKNWTALNNQILTSATQIYKQERVESQVDIIITDSPILLGTFYWNDPNKRKKYYFTKLLAEIYKEKNNFNIFIDRKKKYNPVGRNQTESESKAIDAKVLELLNKYNIDFSTIPGTVDGTEEAVSRILQKINS